MKNKHRIETDSMGEMEVPVEALYGAQTARAVENFPISRLRFSRPFIQTLGRIKREAARANAALGRLPEELADAIQQAAAEVAEGKWDDQFVVDVLQTGSGTSTNMNANEVIANRAGELLGASRGDKRVHPNDHVNAGQSSNDVIPTAMNLAALDQIVHELIPALSELQTALATKAEAFHDVIKIGRTHLQDATPIRMGQSFSGYARQVELAVERLEGLKPRLGELALGGTAVGTGLNTHPDFARKVIERLANVTGLPLREATNHFEAQAARDGIVETSGVLKTVAVSLIKIANDLRFLGSGPRCGLGELRLPATQPGSSIMPGKVNPVMCEMLIQVGAQVIGNDATIAFGGSFGNFELNVMLPVMTHNVLESIEILASGTRTFSRRCMEGLEADEAACAEYVERSLALVTGLVPAIGYDASAAIAKEALRSGRTLREVALDQTDLGEKELDDLIDPKRQTHPD